MHSAEPQISEQERLGLVPPTMPPLLARPLPPGYTDDGELVIRTHRRLAIVAMCLCWPVGLVALTLSYISLWKLWIGKYDSSYRWSKWAGYISWTSIAFGTIVLLLYVLRLLVLVSI